ncbi:MAG TPA: CpsD/CapB family tyrosine-protein kinase [Methylococcaceae bacterium]|nr:CpsD/CapB family tyrosine-protein kinase [Methylococcaceae bacterium]
MTHSPPAFDQLPAGMRTPSLANGKGNPPENINYTQTRTAKISRDFLRSQRIIAGYDSCPFVDSYKVLRTKVLQKMRENGWNALAVTSPGPGCGKSLTAINLAISLALEVHQTVLLVDANLRHPAVHRYLGITPDYGLSDYLLDNTPIEKILVNPEGFSRFVLLPCKRPLLESSEMLASQKMAALVDELKSRYPSRYTLFDLPHLGTADALSFAPFVDAVLLVAEEGRTTHDELAQAVDALQGPQLLGVVLNKADIGALEAA